MTNTRQEIKKDLEYLKAQLLDLDPKIKKDEYAFNYWILIYLYNLDEEACINNVVDGSGDKGIDCFVHYEENKELYIIQNKFYDEDTCLNVKEISYFLTQPLASLNKKEYKRSGDLQELYTKIKDDKEYTIFLHFYVSNDKIDKNAETVVKEYNSPKKDQQAEIFYLKDIAKKRYGESYSDKKTLKATLSTVNKGTYLSILPEDYHLSNMSKTYFVMAQVDEIYSELWEKANSKKYPLFEKNIRDYLGHLGRVNKGIITTLKNPNEKERSNFFYYNNGITIICEEVIKKSSRELILINPQIVNGCQTVNSIAKVLKNESPEKIDKKYKNIYVMAKILVLKEESDEDRKFYENVVKYTNSQNPINKKAFGAVKQPFFTIQKELKKRGFLVVVKESDENTFREQYKKGGDEYNGILEKVNKFKDFYCDFKNIKDLSIDLHKLLQLVAAFYKKDAHYAYTKKKYLLDPDSEHYKKFSSKIQTILSIESMAKLIVIFKTVEKDRKNKEQEDKRVTSPYYLLNFIGLYLEKKKIDLDLFLKNVSTEELKIVYTRFKEYPKEYIEECKRKYDLEYTPLIKKPVSNEIMINIWSEDLKALRKYNSREYDKLMQIFQKFKNSS